MKRSKSAVSALSIRKLLVLLLVINAAALALLSGVSIMSNGEIRGSQRDLIEISEIQANRSEILTAVQGLLVRQSQIMAAASSNALQAAADRSALESASRESMAALHSALSNPLLQSTRTEAELQGLNDAFASLLSADTHVFQRTREILRLGEQQRSLAAELETTFALLQSSAADLSNDVDFMALSAQIAMKKLLRAAPDDPPARDQVEQYREAGKRLISDEIRRAKDLIAQIQLEIASLAALTGTIIQPHDASSLTTLVENRLRPLIESIDSALKQLAALLANSDADPGDQGLQQQLAQLKAQLLDAPESLALTAAAITESREAQATAVASQQAATRRVTTALAALGQITDSKRTEVSSATTSRLDGTQMTILAVSGLTLLVALGIGGGIIFLVLRPLRYITEALQDIGQGEGDLSKRLAPGSVVEINALANGFNHFAAKVESLVANVVDASHRLRDQAGRSAEVSHQISEQLRQHQQETDRVAASLSDLSQSIAMVAANGQHASDTAHQAKDQASTGRGIVEDSRSAIEALAAEIDEAATSLITLGQDTSNVNRVLDVINGVAEQTNLLALNAAIEAARAGEQGRGFAVVAEEVRTLASKTQESTIEIAEILERLRSGSAAVSSTISASHEKATTAVALANDTNRTFDGIAEAIASINQMSGDISSAVLGQSEATDAIDSQVSRIHAASLATAEEAERAAQMAAELADLGRELASMVAQFKVGS